MPELGEANLGLRERKKQWTRATLIDAAVQLCDRQGFERTTVDQIAAFADVSPRTFSRYFATKDAVVLASVDEVVAFVATELARQPADISHLEALYRATVAAFNSTKDGSPGGVTADRLVAAARIVNSSQALKQAVLEYRPDATMIELAKRMGVSQDDSRLRLLSTVWCVILLTSSGDLGENTDGQEVTVDGLISRLTTTYAQFAQLMADIGDPLLPSSNPPQA